MELQSTPAFCARARHPHSALSRAHVWCTCVDGLRQMHRLCRVHWCVSMLWTFELLGSSGLSGLWPRSASTGSAAPVLPPTASFTPGDVHLASQLALAPFPHAAPSRTHPPACKVPACRPPVCVPLSHAAYCCYQPNRERV